MKSSSQESQELSDKESSSVDEHSSFDKSDGQDYDKQSAFSEKKIKKILFWVNLKQMELNGVPNSQIDLIKPKVSSIGDSSISAPRKLKVTSQSSKVIPSTRKQRIQTYT